MTPSLKKRFWKTAEAKAVEGGFTVVLDSYPLRTPSKAAFLCPNAAIADLAAEEWAAQEEAVNPEAMPATRMVNSVIDKVTVNRDAIIAMLGEYGGSDLLCYRATAPEALAARQAEAWDPLLTWAAKTHAAPLVVTAGVMPVDQPQKSVENLTAEIAKLDNFGLGGFHDLVTISGSLILALAVVANHLSPKEAFDLSRIDEEYQIEQWGEDEEAAATAAKKLSDFVFAARFMELSRQ